VDSESDYKDNDELVWMKLSDSDQRDFISGSDFTTVVPRRSIRSNYMK